MPKNEIFYTDTTLLYYIYYYYIFTQAKGFGRK